MSQETIQQTDQLIQEMELEKLSSLIESYHFMGNVFKQLWEYQIDILVNDDNPEPVLPHQLLELNKSYQDFQSMSQMFLEQCERWHQLDLTDDQLQKVNEIEDCIADARRLMNKSLLLMPTHYSA